MNFRHWVIPHPETHKKAHLVSWYGLLCYLLIFILLQVTLNWWSTVQPGVLGVTSEIQQPDVIRLTNVQRQKYNLPALKEDSRLNEAAYQKALNMFEEDYWAHYSPSGKDPWGFIQAAGYKFSYAGENLARNFYTSEEVVQAWMDSPSHRANILNNKYEDIGIAVVEGVLNGQKTTLVVQEFGTAYEAVAEVPQPTTEPLAMIPESSQVQSLGVESVAPQTKQTTIKSSGITLDPYLVIRTFGLSLIGLIAALIILDWYVLHRRAVVRVGARHWPHLAMLGAAASSLVVMNPGSIL